MNAVYKKSPRIVVVDDILENIQLIGKILRENNFLVSVAQNGEQALKIIKKDLPDLILLDIVMPGMDGYETSQHLKNDPETKNIPVIFLSALTDTKDKVVAFKAGAVDFISKPVAQEELLARIRLHLTVKFLQDDLENQVSMRTRELVEANEALSKREEDYRSVMRAVPDPIIVYDLEGRTVYLNPSFTRVFGWTLKELIGKKPPFVVEGEWDRTQKAIQKTLREKHITDFETRRYNKKGEILDVSISGASYQDFTGKDVGLVVNLRDITEWKKTREMMIQNEKMMSLGGLAAGMAHEIKNPLGAIINNAQIVHNRILGDIPANIQAAEKCSLSLAAVKDYAEKREVNFLLESIRKAGTRVISIIDNMLSFSREGKSNFAPVSLTKLMDKTIEIAEQDYDIKKKYDFRLIKIIRHYDNNLPQVHCQDSQIQQVFFNILKNGSEAMSQDPDKKNTPQFILRILQDNDKARVEIEDNGPGMDDDIKQKVFEPFFTTKGSDHGTGLGLSVSYFIINKNHGGTISLESTPGKGSKFIILLPILQDAQEKSD